MPIEFLNSQDVINWGALATTADITHKIISACIYPHSTEAVEANNFPGPILSQYVFNAGDRGWEFSLTNDLGPTNALYYFQTFNNFANLGAWYANNVITINTYQQVAISYDNSAVGNDPRMYVNGVSKTVTEETTPVGTVDSASAFNLRMGYVNVGATHITYDGLIGNLQVFDITSYSWTTTQIDSFIAWLHGKRSMRLRFTIPMPVFSIKGNCAAGLQVFNGTALGATNYIIDDVAGASGTPSGNPVGRDEVYLAY